MKIQNPYGIQPKQANIDDARKAGKNEGPGFAHFLEQASRADQVRSTQESAGLQAPSAAGLSQAQMTALGKGEEVLGILESMAGILGSDQASDADLSALQEIMAELKEKVAGMTQAREQLAQDDPLRATLDEIEVLGQVEYMKITRGDYST